MRVGGGNPGVVYGTGPLPTEMAWNPTKFAANGGATGAAASQALGAGAAMQGAGGFLPIAAIVVVLWLLAERHANIRGGGNGSISGAFKL